MQKIIPNLWFNGNAEEAVNFYASVFNDVKIKEKTYHTKEISEVSGMPEGSVLTIAFQIFGQDFLALNGGPQFRFNEAISFIVQCKDQKEIDYYWEKLSADPKAEQCGWLKDKFGLSWQIVPENLTQLLQMGNTAKVNEAFLQMKKIDIDELREVGEA